jgi:hypothetical protein
VSAFDPEQSAYGIQERLASAQVGFAQGPGFPTEAVARLMADACTIPNPPLRYPADAQAASDNARRIPDETFLRLARCDLDPALYEGQPGWWGLQRVTLGGA